ncbi:hypothetical protein [Antrihabitans sp. YC2-6]|uniref:hypothetical protein n=1 Tax=Antrihabitans sp. YC2-6 TaxID=2799498 RepID=UPI0018F5129A|nr:hypothetical protein [Antrihabitans sp. YC2-6]MBJ8343524.1 hypothetical protein [Antrihabitans sp. YC2-6]
MHMLVKRSIACVFAAGAVAAAPVAFSGTASAEPWGCTTTPVVGTSAFSECAGDGWHRVHITCWNWWGSSGGFYERWGNPAFGRQQSWSSCDVPFSLRSWNVTF